MNRKQLPFIFLIVFLVACNAASEKATTVINQSDKSISNLQNKLDSLFTWDVEILPNGIMMYLDVPYTVDGKAEYLSLTVAKEASNERPTFISVIVANDLDDSGIMEIIFTNKDYSESQAVFAILDKRNEDFCAFRMNSAYAVDKANKEVDVFRNFLTYDIVYFNFVRRDGTQTSVSVPLYSFKEQYK
jgi:hypothetical protein